MPPRTPGTKARTRRQPAAAPRPLLSPLAPSCPEDRSPPPPSSAPPPPAAGAPRAGEQGRALESPGDASNLPGGWKAKAPEGRQPPLPTNPCGFEPSRAQAAPGRGARPWSPRRSPTCLDAEQEEQDAEKIPGAASASHRGGCAGIGGPFHVPALAQVHGARQSRAPRAESAEQRPLLPAPSLCAPATPLPRAPPRLPSLPPSWVLLPVGRSGLCSLDVLIPGG